MAVPRTRYASLNGWSLPPVVEHTVRTPSSSTRASGRARKRGRTPALGFPGGGPCRNRVAILLFYAGAAWPSPARGNDSPAANTQAPSERFELYYTAPPECPNEQAFLAWTSDFYAGEGERDEQSRDGSLAPWLAPEGELAGTVRVRVVSMGSQYVAHLVMVTADGRCSTSRPAHTETDCVDAARAMAYSLAEALRAPSCATEQPSSTRPQQSCPTLEHTEAPAALQCPRPPPVAPRPKSVRGELGVGLGGVAPIAGDVAWGGALFAGFRGVRSEGPSGRLAMGYWSAGRVPLGAALRAQAWSLGVSLCPVELRVSRAISLPLCAMADVGQVAISGFGAAAQGGESSDTPGAAPLDGDRANLYLWSMLGVAARLRVKSGWLFAELDPNLAMPLLRHPVYGHQPSSEASDRQLMGRVGQWFALKALVDVGVAFP